MKYVHTVGRRKTAVARAIVKSGKGSLTINNKTLDEYTNCKATKLRIQEPLIISNKEKSYDIRVKVEGGGNSSQADALRQAIANGIIKYTGDDDLREKFLEYDRSLLVSDTRYKETNKPNNSKARAKRQKSYR